eukprot:2121928-Prymnesium_polylepis.1
MLYVSRHNAGAAQVAQELCSEFSSICVTNTPIGSLLILIQRWHLVACCIGPRRGRDWLQLEGVRRRRVESTAAAGFRCVCVWRAAALDAAVQG